MSQTCRNQTASAGRAGQGAMSCPGSMMPNMGCPGSSPNMNRSGNMPPASNTGNMPCPCTRNNTLESMDQAQLFCHINEVSFAVVDSALYLDTHPHDCDALAYNREMVAMRNAALKVYARRFGPLTIDCTEEVTSNSWVWILQPWPWEAVSKGGCR